MKTESGLEIKNKNESYVVKEYDIRELRNGQKRAMRLYSDLTLREDTILEGNIILSTIILKQF